MFNRLSERKKLTIWRGKIRRCIMKYGKLKKVWCPRMLDWMANIWDFQRPMSKNCRCFRWKIGVPSVTLMDLPAVCYYYKKISLFPLFSFLFIEILSLLAKTHIHFSVNRHWCFSISQISLLIRSATYSGRVFSLKNRLILIWPWHYVDSIPQISKHYWTLVFFLQSACKTEMPTQTVWQRGIMHSRRQRGQTVVSS